jgi:NADP-dependent 3-hydroxy acid dehydrogenase YdfG
MAERNGSTAEEISALTNKVVLVTGGASGLGRDVTLRAAERGAKVAILDVRADRLSEVKAYLDGLNQTSITMQADVTKEDDVTGAIAETVRTWGRLDVVVNSAGVFRGGMMTDTSMADFDLMFDINVRGLFLVSREAAKVMIPQASGHIINIASIGAKHVFPKEIAYSASKWAVIGIGEGMSVELGPLGVRVTTVCPTGMNTTFWDEIRLGRPNWDVTKMLNSDRVAQAIIQAASLPPDVVIKEVLVYQPGQ